MSIRRGMLFTLGAKIKNLVDAFKARVLNTQGEFEAESCLNTQLTQLDNQNLLDNASLVVTPNGYEENLLFAVEPDKVGTNLLLHSQDWTQAVWNKGGATIISSTRLAPDGTPTGTELSDVGASSTPGVTVQSIITTSTNIVYSIYTKNVNSTTRRFLLRNSTTATNFDVLIFDYSSTGNLGNGWFSENVGNGWFRLSFTRTTGINIGDLLLIYYGRTTSASVGATDVWQVWGAQIDTGSTLNEYIPTTSVRIINGTIGDMSVTRATTATRVNADGFIEVVPYNLFQRSEEFENGFWNKQRTTIGQNVIAAPDGTLTADNLIANSGVTYDYTGVNGVNVVSTSFLLNTDQRTLSFYLKYNGLNRIRVIYGSATSLGGAVFVEVDLQLGIITSSNGGIVASNFFIEDAGNNWYRVGFNLITTLSTTNNRFAIGLGDTTKTIANGIDGVYLWGAQLVTGAQPKDYFPTTNGFNVPRIDYSNGSCPSILVEPQRTNLVLRSEEFENANWIKTNTTITSNTTISPSGIQNADKIVEVNGGNTPRVISIPTLVIGTAYTLSFYLKSAERNQVRAVFEGSAARSAYFNSTTGVVSVIGGSATASMSLLNNGWYRCSITITPTQTNGGFYIATAENNETINSGDNTKGIFIWGAQLEAGTNTTSYIPTVASTVTRNADVITNTNLSTLIGQTEGAMFVDFNYQMSNPLADSFIATISDGTLSNHLIFAVLTTGNAAAILRTSGTNVIFISIPAASFTFGRKKIVISYKSGETNLYVNGVKIGSTITTAFSFPVTINKFNLGSSGTNGGLSNTTINSSALYKTTLTDAQAIQLTTL